VKRDHTGRYLRSPVGGEVVRAFVPDPLPPEPPLAPAVLQEMLERMGIVRELTGKKRGRIFGYGRYVAILAGGTELTGQVDPWP